MKTISFMSLAACSLGIAHVAHLLLASSMEAEQVAAQTGALRFQQITMPLKWPTWLPNVYLVEHTANTTNARSTTSTTINNNGRNGTINLKNLVPAATDHTLNTLMWSIVYYITANVVVVLIYGILRLRFPMVYRTNVLIGAAPEPSDEGFFGWIRAARAVKRQEIIDSAGLDAAMLLHFIELGMKLCVVIGVPHVLIIGPINAAINSNPEPDLHRFMCEITNFMPNSHNNWLYILCFVVWGVVFLSVRLVCGAMRSFLHYRFEWLHNFSPPRSRTILVQGVPKEHRSDEKLAAFFERVLPGEQIVQRAYIIKNTTALQPRYEALRAAQLMQNEARHRFEDEDTTEEQKKNLQKELEDLDAEVDDLRAEVEAKRSTLHLAIADGRDVCCASGFVTFNTTRDADVALRLSGSMSFAKSDWRLSIPPETHDVNWKELIVDDIVQKEWGVLGKTLLMTLFFSYFPLIVWVTELANVLHMGPLDFIWRRIAPSMGLMFMVWLLPKLLKIIFDTCFETKSVRWKQLMMQNAYFWFQLVYLVLGVPIGQDVVGFLRVMMLRPTNIIQKLGATMPSTSHFFMVLLVLQGLYFTIYMCRISNLFKYLLFSWIYPAGVRGKMAELLENKGKQSTDVTREQKYEQPELYGDIDAPRVSRAHASSRASASGSSVSTKV